MAKDEAIDSEQKGLNLEPLLDSKTVSKILRCSVPLIYKMANDGRLPCIRWDCPGKGRKRQRTIVRFLKKDIINFIHKHYATT